MTKRKSASKIQPAAIAKVTSKAAARSITIHFAGEFETGENHRHVEPTEGLDNSSHHESYGLATTFGPRILCRRRA